MGRTETLFAVGNGYLGLRGNVEEGRDGHEHGTFINGFHETWPIRHAEEAFGFARVGQTIVNAPDAKIIRLYVDDEPLVLTEADLPMYERRLDFADGVLRARRSSGARPSGKRVLIDSRRMVSFTDRHLAFMDYEVTLLDADASVAISSQILNRQDGGDEYHAGTAAASKGFDPRKADVVHRPRAAAALKREHRRPLRARLPVHQLGHDHRRRRRPHDRDRRTSTTESSQIDDDLAKHVYRIRAKAGPAASASPRP